MAENFFPEGTPVSIKVENNRFTGKVLAYNYVLHRYRIEVADPTEFERVSHIKPEEGFGHIFYIPEANVGPYEDSSQV
jgi:hypothetical protein